MNVAEVTPVKFSKPTVQHITSNSRITDPNLTKFLQDVQKYFRLLFWKQNCDIPIRFGMPEYRMKVDCRIAAELQQKLWVLTA